MERKRWNVALFSLGMHTSPPIWWSITAVCGIMYVRRMILPQEFLFWLLDFLEEVIVFVVMIVYKRQIDIPCKNKYEEVKAFIYYHLYFFFILFLLSSSNSLSPSSTPSKCTKRQNLARLAAPGESGQKPELYDPAVLLLRIPNHSLSADNLSWQTVLKPTNFPDVLSLLPENL